MAITMTEPLEAMIFDLDGTLANTMPSIARAFQMVLAEHYKGDLASLDLYSLFGPSEEGIFERLMPDRWELCHATYLEACEQLHSDDEVVFAGMTDALDLLRSTGLRLGVVTAKGAKSAELSLRLLGMNNFFDNVLTGSPTGNNKPENIRTLLAEWCVAPARAAYVGDMTADVLSSREVGVIPLSAAWAPTANYAALVEMEPHATFRSVAEFDAWIREHVVATRVKV